MSLSNNSRRLNKLNAALHGHTVEQVLASTSAAGEARVLAARITFHTTDSAEFSTTTKFHLRVNGQPEAVFDALAPALRAYAEED